MLVEAMPYRGCFAASSSTVFADNSKIFTCRNPYGKKDWVVHCKPAVQGTRTVLNYLARYIHRVAFTNSLIISADYGKVTFRCPSIQRKNAPN